MDLRFICLQTHMKLQTHSHTDTLSSMFYHGVSAFHVSIDTLTYRLTSLYVLFVDSSDKLLIWTSLRFICIQTHLKLQTHIKLQTHSHTDTLRLFLFVYSSDKLLIWTSLRFLCVQTHLKLQTHITRQTHSHTDTLSSMFFPSMNPASYSYGEVCVSFVYRHT